MSANITPSTPVLTGRETLVHRIALGLVGRYLGTFGGWVTRQAIRLTGVMTVALTAWLTGKWTSVEDLVARLGASSSTLADIHAQGVQLATIIAAVIASLVMGALDILLSRIAAYVREQPIDIHANVVE